jgi:hypothetical protein
VPVSHRTARDAATARNAFGGEADHLAFLGIRSNNGRLVRLRARHEVRHGLLVLLKKRSHIDHQIFHNRKVVQWPHGDLFLFEVGKHCLARQRIPAIDDHAARPTHTDSAGITKSQGRLMLSLNQQKSIEYGCKAFIEDLKLKTLEAPFLSDSWIISKYLENSPSMGISSHFSAPTPPG